MATPTPIVVVSGLSSAKGVAIDGNNLYVAEYTANKISVVDLLSTIPATTTLVTGLNHPREIVIHGNNLYVHQAYSNKISRINLISGPPTVTDVVPPTNFISGLTVYNNHLYYCDFEDNFSLISKRICRLNLDNPTTTPKIFSDHFGNEGGMAFYNDKLYTNGQPGYYNMNVTTIAEFDFTTSPPTVKDLMSEVGAYQLAFYEGSLYSRGLEGIHKVNLDNQRPTATDVTYRVLPMGLALKGNNLYISDHAQDGRIVKVDITAPTYLPSDFAEYGGGDLIIHGDDLYLARTNYVLKFDTNIVNPQPEYIVDYGGANQHMALKNNDLYISDGSGIFKVDITNPALSPVELIMTPEGTGGMAFIGNDLYTVGGGGDKIVKINITEPNPVITTVMEGLSPLWTITAKGNEIYYADWNNNVIMKIDTTVPSSTPVPVVYEVEQVMAMTFKGDMLFMTEGTGKITKFDTSSTPMSAAKPLKQSVYVYPLPADDYIKLSGLKRAELYRIYSVDGKTVGSGTTNGNEVINVQGLSAGTYIVKFESSNSIKFIKK